jgi:hypothetical protein
MTEIQNSKRFYDLGQLKIEGNLAINMRKLERSDSTNIQSSIINSQSGSGLSGLGHWILEFEIYL